MIAQSLSLELDEVTVVAATYWLEAASRLAPILDDQSNVLHAGEAETSMMLQLEPDLVDDGDLASHRTQADLSFLLAGEVARAWGSKEVLYISSLLCAIGMITIALFFKEMNQDNDTN